MTTSPVDTASPLRQERVALPTPPAVIDDRVAWRALGARTLVAYVFLAATFTAVGLLYVHLDPLDGLRDQDLEVSRWFAEHRSAPWDDLAMLWSRVADTVAIVGVAAVVIALLWWRHHRAAAALIGFGLVLEAATFITTNNLVRRDRPPVATLGETPTTFSFPSGHVAATIVLYGALVVIALALTRTRWLRTGAVLIAVVVSLSVALARVYRGMHFLSDVVAGVVLGLVILALVFHFIRATTPDQREMTP